MDQRWALLLPVLFGLSLIGGSLIWYGPAGPRYLKKSVLLRAVGPGIITMPFLMGIAALISPVAYLVWPVEWARNVAMTALVAFIALAWLSFAWVPTRLLPGWLQPIVRKPSWVAAIGTAAKTFTVSIRRLPR